MKNYLNPILLLAGLMAFSASFSQPNFLPGELFLANGDTLQGLIDYQNWEHNPRQISFRKGNNSAEEVLQTTDIAGFSVADEVYLSAIVDVETSPVKLGEILKDPALNIKTDTTFLQVLVGGEKSLLYYRTEKGRDYFYISQNGVYELLIYKLHTKLTDVPGLDKHLIIENKKYLAQLTLYLHDCDFSQARLEKMEYRRKHMEKLFLEYYACTNALPVFEKKREKVRAEFGPVAGPTLTTLSFQSTFYDGLASTEFSRPVSPSLGFFVDLLWPRELRRWSFYNEIMFSSYRVSGDYEDYRSEINYEFTTYDLGFSYLKINNFLRYKRPIGALLFFVNAGMANGVALSEINYQTSKTSTWGLVKEKEGPVIAEPRKSEAGFLLGAGAVHRGFSLEARYESGTGISQYAGLGSRTRRYSVMLAYRF